MQENGETIDMAEMIFSSDQMENYNNVSSSKRHENRIENESTTTETVATTEEVKV